MGTAGRRPYTTGDAVLDAAIERLAHDASSDNPELIAEILTTALKLARDGAERGDIKIVNTSLKEMRHAFRVFRKYRGLRKVSIFGSARTPPTSPEYEQARQLGRDLVGRGYMVITGAGPGIMRAGNEGAGTDHSFGVNIRLPFEQTANDIIEGSPRLIHYKYFFTRKLSFLKESDAIVLLPGGFGTMDEGFEALTLIQTGKSRIMPVICLDAPGGTYWRTWERYVHENLLDRGMIAPADLALFKITDGVSEACAEIVRFYSNFHSMRFARDLTVLRVHRLPSESHLQEWSHEFSDIMEGKLQPIDMLAEEANEADTAALPRLACKFDRRHFGRLRSLIDRLNQA